MLKRTVFNIANIQWIKQELRGQNSIHKTLSFFCCCCCCQALSYCRVEFYFKGDQAGLEKKKKLSSPPHFSNRETKLYGRADSSVTASAALTIEVNLPECWPPTDLRLIMTNHSGRKQSLSDNITRWEGKMSFPQDVGRPSSPCGEGGRVLKKALHVFRKSLEL